jgi:hypothetical protein
VIGTSSSDSCSYYSFISSIGKLHGMHAFMTAVGRARAAARVQIYFFL